MECSKAREAISCRVDGEEAGPRAAGLARHLHSCAPCRTYLDDIRALDTLTRAARAGRRDLPDVTDLTASVLAAARTDRRRRPDACWPLAWRCGLVAVGAAQLALALPGLIFGTDEGAPIHVAHEVGAWDLALAVGFVYAAWRPLRALGLLPFAAALSAGLILTAIVDVAHGRAVALTETTHLLELVGTALLYLLLAPRVRRRPEPGLRPV